MNFEHSHERVHIGLSAGGVPKLVRGLQTDPALGQRAAQLGLGPRVKDEPRPGDGQPALLLPVLAGQQGGAAGRELGQRDRVVHCLPCTPGHRTRGARTAPNNKDNSR